MSQNKLDVGYRWPFHNQLRVLEPAGLQTYV